MRLALAVLLIPFCLSAQATSKDRVKYAKSLRGEGSNAIPKLTPYMQDPDPEVRREVVKTIVSIGGAGTLEPLTAGLQDNDEEVQIRATDGLVNFYLPGYVESGLSGSIKRTGSKLTSRWTDSNDQIIPGFVVVRPEIVQAIAKLVTGGASRDVRANAIRAVGVLRGREGIDELARALSSKDGKLMYEVMVAFEKIRDPGTASKLHYLLRDPEEKVQLAALETVGLLMNPESVPFLREAYDRARNDKIRRAALNALAMIPAEESRPLFQAQLGSGDEQMRAAAAEGIGRLGRLEDREAMRKGFEDETKMRPRLALAFAAVRLGDHGREQFGPLTYLINTLNQKAWSGVAEAFLAELFRNEDLRKAAYLELPNRNRQEKISLAQVLARAGAKDSEPALEALSRDSDEDVAKEAMTALRSLRALPR